MFCWRTVQRATCISKTTFLRMKFQISVPNFYRGITTIRRHKKVYGPFYGNKYSIKCNLRCNIIFPIFSVSNQFECPVLDELNVKKTWSLLNIKNLSINNYGTLNDYQFSIKYVVTQNIRYFLSLFKSFAAQSFELIKFKKMKFTFMAPYLW